MNCKQGDLAVIVRTKRNHQFIGKIIRCIRLVSWPGGEPTWEFEPKFDKYCCILDSCLRPIRDNPGADETLTWLPVHEKEAA